MKNLPNPAGSFLDFGVFADQLVGVVEGISVRRGIPRLASGLYVDVVSGFVGTA